MKTKFLVADEIRPEASGKLTILGLFADDVVMTQVPPRSPQIPADTPAGIERLAFLINISELSVGAHTIRAQALDPSGQEYGNGIPQSEITTELGKSHSMIIEMKPFILRDAGTYTWVVWIDDQEYRHPFEVRIVNMDSGG